MIRLSMHFMTYLTKAVDYIAAIFSFQTQ